MNFWYTTNVIQYEEQYALGNIRVYYHGNQKFACQ